MADSCEADQIWLEGSFVWPSEEELELPTSEPSESVELSSRKCEFTTFFTTQMLPPFAKCQFGRIVGYMYLENEENSLWSSLEWGKCTL